MFKLHKDINNWYYWYSPRYKLWCAMDRHLYNLYKHNNDAIHIIEYGSIKSISKNSLKQIMKDFE